MAETPKPLLSHIVMLPSPGMGHLIPFIELAKRLVQLHHNFHVTCVVPTVGPPSSAIKASLEALPPTITHTFPSPVDSDDQSDGVSHAELLKLAVTRSLPALHDLLKSLTGNGDVYGSVVLLADLFSIGAFEVAMEFNIPAYLFYHSNAMSLSLLFYLPNLDQIVSPTRYYKDVSEPITIPGCIPVHGTDLPDPLLDRNSGAYNSFLDTVKRFRFAKGIVVNTFLDVEMGPLKALMEDKESNIPPVYPVGPLVRVESNNPVEKESEIDCLRWLSNQPRDSVLFVSFGSGGTLSQAQLTELAFGLEMSGQRFIWVVRSPNDESALAAYFNSESQQHPFDFLPKGFLERTKQRGFVIPSWAPQAQILSHVATGGFLTHCGWNSILESFVNGVPLIAWPLYAEQRMNAVGLTKDTKVALQPEVDENGLIAREEVARVVRELMEGEERKVIRNRMKELKIAGERALTEKGSSTKALSALALEWQ